jgi:hypothetical protein
VSKMHWGSHCHQEVSVESPSLSKMQLIRWWIHKQITDSIKKLIPDPLLNVNGRGLTWRSKISPITK